MKMDVELTPDNGEGLEDKVHRDPVEDRADGPGFSEVQEAKDNLDVSCGRGTSGHGPPTRRAGRIWGVRALKSGKLTQYVSHCLSSFWLGDSIAWTERYAGSAQPMRFEMGEARPNMLKKIKTTELRRELGI